MGKRGVSANTKCRYKPAQGLMKFPVLRAPLAKPPALPTCQISELAEKITRPHFLPFPLPSTELSGSSRLWASSELPLWRWTNRKPSPDTWKDAGVQSWGSLWGVRESDCLWNQVSARKRETFNNEHKCKKTKQKTPKHYIWLLNPKTSFVIVSNNPTEPITDNSYQNKTQILKITN